MSMAIKEKNVVGELIFGINPVVELLKARKRKIISFYTTKPTPRGWEKIEEQLPPNYTIPIQYVTRDVLSRMAESTDHQGVIAWVKPFGYRKVPFNPEKSPLIVVLDGIQDPHNVGALIRSAYCTGADGVVLIQKNGAPLSAVALKSSAGLAEHMEIYQFPSAEMAMQEIKKWGYTIYSATFQGKSAAKITFVAPTCIVVGSEGFGVSQVVMKNSIQVTIPQRNTDISYNASVAGALLLYIVATQQGRI